MYSISIDLILSFIELFALALSPKILGSRQGLLVSPDTMEIIASLGPELEGNYCPKQTTDIPGSRA